MHFMTDDQLTRHEKWHRAGEHGQALWFPVGSNCAAANREGLVPGHMLRAWAPVHFTPSRLTAGTKALVKAGLWHDHDTLCARCFERHGELEQGDYRFHDWLDWQFQADAKHDPMVKMRDNRRKRLHRAGKLKLAIRTRDQDLCRYCGRLVLFAGSAGDHKSPWVGQFDHINPVDEENSLDKILTCCRRCNLLKGERTPEQAGMTILAPGTFSGVVPPHAPDLPAEIQPGIQPIQSTVPSPGPSGPRVGTGSGRAGSGDGLSIPHTNGSGHTPGGR